MNYQIINKELNIATCEIADLTIEQAQSFLDSWESGAKLGSLTMYVDKATNTLVLNRDHKNFELYLNLAEGYLASTEEKRKLFKEKHTEKMTEELYVLDACIEQRRIMLEMKKIRENSIDNTCDLSILNHILKTKEPFTAVTNAFIYGMMQGKRAERKKRANKVDESAIVLTDLLKELEKMTVEELKVFREEWLGVLRKNNATDKILCFSGTIVDAAIQTKGGELA